MIPLFTGHLLSGAIVAGVLLLIVLAFQAGRAHEQLGRRRRRPIREILRAAPLVRLEWVNEIPVAILECDGGRAADVAAWLEAAKQGPVLRV